MANLKSSVSPFIYVCKLFGLAPVNIVQSYESNSGHWFTRQPSVSNNTTHCAGREKISLFKCQMLITGRIFNITLIASIIASTPVHIMRTHHSAKLNDTFLSIYINNLIDILQTLIALLIIMFTCGSQWKRLESILNIFNRIDNILMQNKAIVYRSTRNVLFWEISVICMGTIPFFFLNTMRFSNTWLEAFVRIISAHLVLCVSFIFNILVGNMALLVKQRLFHLNVQISNIALTYGSDEQEVTSSPSTSHTFLNRSFALVDIRPVCEIAPIDSLSDQPRNLRLNSLRQAHSSLCDAIHTINEMFGLLLLLNLIVNFIVLIQKLHWIMEIAPKGITESSVSLFYMELITIMNVGFLMLSCDSASSEASYTLVALQKMTLPRDVGQPIMAEVQLFLQQITNMKVQFTAGRFFTLDRVMLFSALGALMTYLVILVQFQTN